MLIAKFVAGFGCTPVSVATGEAALAVAIAEPPALVISDAEMPGMTGWELCRQLRAAAATRTTPVLIVTAAAGNLRAAVERAVADEFLHKPFTVYELRTAVRQLLDRPGVPGRDAHP